MYKSEKDIRLRIDEDLKKEIQAKARKFGFRSISDYMRFVSLNCKEIEVKIKEDDDD